MAEVVLMPKMSDTMEEGTIASWIKTVGDAIQSGDVIAEVETDKATMELEAYEEGTLLYLAVEEGGTVPVDDILYIIGEKGEDFQHLLSAKPQVQTNAVTATEKPQEPKPEIQTPSADFSHLQIVLMPKMSDTMEEGVIASWLKKVGDTLQSGDIIAEVETDKATMELEAYEEGTLLYLAVKEGGSVPVDELLYIVGEKDADINAYLQYRQSQPEIKQTTSQEGSQSSDASPIIENKQVEQESKTEGSRIKVSPLARKMALDKGYDIKQIKGTGDGGRIIKRDIENFKPDTVQKSSEKSTHIVSTANLGEESYEEVKVSQMRKTIARRLSESKFTAPHFYLTMEIVMDEVMKAHKQVNEYSPVKVSFNDMIIKASAMALKKHPAVNSSWLSDSIRINHHVHVGMAVAVDAGLLVPVIRFADQKSLSQIAAETKDLAQKAKEKKLQPQDWEGNTFSVSNLGMFGIEEFTAIINPPDACIMAVGTIKQTALVKEGQLVVGNVMKVTLSCDHRVVDGASGSAFLQTFKSLLENPVKMLV